MGRYSTTQIYSDQDVTPACIANAPTGNNNESHGIDGTDQRGGLSMAVKQGDSGAKRVKLNRVENVSGSSAGAGSGEFHTYRASRRRELDRIEMMEKEHAKKKDLEEFEEKRKRGIETFQAQTQKRAEKRRRRKERAKSRATESTNSENGTAPVDSTKHEGEKAPTTELLDSIPEIPNDGSFLETMLKLQQQKNKGEKKEVNSAK